MPLSNDRDRRGADRKIEGCSDIRTNIHRKHNHPRVYSSVSSSTDLRDEKSV